MFALEPTRDIWNRALANQETEAKGSAKARGALGYPAHATRLLPPTGGLHSSAARESTLSQAIATNRLRRAYNQGDHHKDSAR